MDIPEFKDIRKYPVVIFDLDNTLYDECSYLLPAYQDMALFTGRQTHEDAIAYAHFLINTFKEEGRTKLFDKYLKHFNLEKVIEVEDLLEIQRNIQTPLIVYSSMDLLLRDLLLNHHKVYILTNGNAIQQKNKIRNLNIQDLLPQITIVYANEYIPKPSPICLYNILEKEKVTKESAIFIGDSAVDKAAAESAGIDFMNVNKIIKDDFARY